MLCNYMISKEALQEFKKIWKSEHNGKELPNDKALEMAQRILRIVELIYRPIPKKIKK